MTKRMPNILLIVLDAARVDHLSCYGYHRDTTPNIDKIAGMGTLFENCFSTSPWTMPSHASLFTGKFPSTCGVIGENFSLDKTQITLSQVLSSAGYHTFGITSSPHIGKHTHFNKGFNYFIEAFRRPLLKNGFDLCFKRALNTFRNRIYGGKDITFYITEIAKSWLKKEIHPFFMYLHYSTPHSPYYSPGAFHKKFYRDIESKVDTSRARELASTGDALLSHVLGRIKLTDKEWEVIKSYYDSKLSYLDNKILEILHLLRDLKILNETILVITSDHGENFGEHGLVYHDFCLYDTLIHVPLVVYYSNLPLKKRVTSLVSHVDLFPTILKLSDINTGKTLEYEGIDIFSPRERELRDYIFAEHGGGFLTRTLMKKYPGLAHSKYRRGMKCIRTRELKYILNSDKHEELYDIVNDPNEELNLIEKHSEVARVLRALLEKQFGAIGFFGQDRSAHVRDDIYQDREIIDQLTRLGYL